MPFQKPVSRAAEKRSQDRSKARQWVQVRRQILARDGFRCRACGARDGLDAHHLKFRSAGGTDTPQNLVALCRVCHADMHAYRLFVKGTDAGKALKFVKDTSPVGQPDGGGDVGTGGYRGTLHSRQRGAHP